MRELCLSVYVCVCVFMCLCVYACAYECFCVGVVCVCVKLDLCEVVMIGSFHADEA